MSILKNVLYHWKVKLMNTNETIEIKSYFEDIEKHLIDKLYQATESIFVCVAWISWHKFTPIFNELAKKGIKIEVMYNDDNINKRKFLEPTKTVQLFPIKARWGKYMHNKFCIIDNHTLITGSFNWSKQASLHHENLIIIKNDLDLVINYLKEFYNLQDFFYYKAIPSVICDTEYWNNEKNKTQKCRYHANILGIVGNEYGKYGESMLTIWKICMKGDHATKLNTEYENFPLSHSGLIREDYEDLDEILDKEEKVRLLISERQSLEILRQYFINDEYKTPVHAIGKIIPTNLIEYHQGYDDFLEHSIKTIWTEMYFKKDIPKEFTNCYEFTEQIINEHT